MKKNINIYEKIQKIKLIKILTTTMLNIFLSKNNRSLNKIRKLSKNHKN